MHHENIKAVVDEINAALAGRLTGAIHQLPDITVVLDFRSREGTQLLISVDPKNPRIYLIKRKLREIEKRSVPPGTFVQTLRSTLSRAKLKSASVHESERIVRIVFSAESDTGEQNEAILLAQLTGRSANLLLVNNENVITRALRPPHGNGQQIGDTYQPPPRQLEPAGEDFLIAQGEFPSLSAAIDAFYLHQAAVESFDSRVHQIEQDLRRQLRTKRKLLENLKSDLRQHGNPDELKRLGDLLLANIGTAERRGDKILIRDYYSEGEPLIELELEEKISLQDRAAHFFGRYTKAKRAAEEIKRRMEVVDKEVLALQHRESVLQQIKQTRDEALLANLEGKKPKAVRTTKKAAAQKLPGVRRYLSSDDYEILVGRAAHTNDQLTFKVAKPNDLWLHAADYPGSHVIIRNHSRKDIPHRTIIEAAQLAARFSQAADDSKVDVHYTPRKFLSKPKGAAPGLVRLSQFKTITVTPKEVGERVLS